MTRSILTTAIALGLSVWAHAAPLRVIDGDTVEVGEETIRILNVDTPEIRSAQCDAEHRLGLVAKRRLNELLASGPIEITRGDGKRMTDRHGRTLALISVGGSDVGEVLIAEGLARAWKGKREPWCEAFR